MRAAARSRLDRAEAAAGAHERVNTPAWLAVRKWLGQTLTEEEETAAAEYLASQPPYDPAAPIDMTGWSSSMRDWWTARVP